MYNILIHYYQIIFIIQTYLYPVVYANHIPTLSKRSSIIGGKAAFMRIFVVVVVAIVIISDTQVLIKFSTRWRRTNLKHSYGLWI